MAQRPGKSIGVRSASLNDARRVAELLAQLGYEVRVDEVAARLRRLDERRAVLVATAAGIVAGWIALSIDEHFIEGREVLIEGLVVEERLRNQGVGERLLAEAEAWAVAHGCMALRVQSNVVRDRAHGFYDRNGYQRVKTQHQFRKQLSP